MCPLGKLLSDWFNIAFRPWTPNPDDFFWETINSKLKQWQNLLKLTVTNYSYKSIHGKSPYYTNTYSKYPITYKKCKGLSQWWFPFLCQNLIYTTEYILPNLTTKSLWLSLNNCQFQTKTMTNSLDMIYPQWCL